MTFIYKISKLKDSKEIASCELSVQEFKFAIDGLYYAQNRDMNSFRREVYSGIRAKLWKLGLIQG